MYKPLADSTLMRMSKKEIIECLRIIECNNRICEETIDQQYKNYRMLLEKERADAIDEVEEKLNSTGTEITFDLPVEEILGEDIDLDDFAMLVTDAIQVYRKMVLGILKQMKGEEE